MCCTLCLICSRNLALFATFAVGVASSVSLRKLSPCSHIVVLCCLNLTPLASCHLLQLQDSVSYLQSFLRRACRLLAASWLCTTAVKRDFLPGSRPTILWPGLLDLSCVLWTQSVLLACFFLLPLFLPGLHLAAMSASCWSGWNTVTLTLMPSV